MSKRVPFCCLLALAHASLASPSFAGAFKDKTITMIVNYGAGGNVDTEARIFQRHLPKHLEDRPTIIIQNMPGAAGLTAINQLGLGIGFKDPSITVGFATFNAIAPVIGDPALKVDVGVFKLIAGIGQWYAAYARKDVLPGRKRPADIANAKGVFAAGYARSSNHDIRLRLMFELMGTDFKVVTGFQSVGTINKAIEQGEINFMLSTLPGYESQAVPNLIDTGIAIPMWQLGAAGDDGKLLGSPDLARRGIGFFEDVYKEAHGKLPSGPKYDALLLSNDSSAKLARVVMMPPGASAQAVDEMRKAFLSVVTDKEFVAEHLRIVKMEPILFSGPQAEQSLRKAISNVDPAVKAVLKEAAGVP